MRNCACSPEARPVDGAAEEFVHLLADELLHALAPGQPEAVEAMREIGIDITGHRSKSADEFAGRDFDFIVTVCGSARRTCPVFNA